MDNCFKFSEDYRGNSYYDFWEDGQTDIEYDYYEEFHIPESKERGYRVFLVTPSVCVPDFDRILVASCDCEHEGKEIMLEIHSHLNECGPFETTGMTSSYKETGAYGDKRNVTNAGVLALDITKDYDKPTFAVVVDKTGRIHDWLSITPYS
jgi:hypothetical protein